MKKTRIVLLAILAVAAVAFFISPKKPERISFKASYVTAPTMESNLRQPIKRLTFEAAALVRDFSAKLQDPNKKTVYELACGDQSAHTGTIIFSRWPEQPFPEKVPALSPQFELRPDIFSYGETEAGHMDWHLNFADADLFFGYGSALFAQDEIQVAEHPALASLREMLLAKGVEFSPQLHGRPTPVLIRGVERRCAIALENLYGWRFQRADRATTVSSVKVLRPPTQSNIIAIVAPRAGSGAYTRDEIDLVLQTAYSGFSAAKMDSEKSATTIHTGFWGCGAFGGNRELMALLQILAARLARVDRLVFYTVDKPGVAYVNRAVDDLARILPDGGEKNLREVISDIEALKLSWGTSDGN